MRFLGVELWLWVLEFQQQTGTGWPHWHVLVDLSTLPNQYLDLKRAWHLWRGKWDVGGVDLQVRKRFDNPTGAIFYVTEYLVKYPEMGFPSWVRHNAGIRFFQGCRKLGPICSERRYRSRTEANDDERDGQPVAPRNRRRTLAEREAECGMKSIALVESDAGGGEVTHRFAGSLAVAPNRLVMLHQQHKISGLVVERKCVEGEGFVSQWLDVSLPFDGDEKRKMQSLRDDLLAAEEDMRCLRDIEDRFRLLDHNSKWRDRSDEVKGGER
jgi:hypothetical protein